MAKALILILLASGSIACATAANRAAVAEDQRLAEQDIACDDYEMPTGSHIAESVCRDTKQIEKTRQQTQQMVRNLARLRAPEGSSVVTPTGH